MIGPFQMPDTKVEFRVTDQWPLPWASTETKNRAVQDLVANHTLVVGQSRSGKTNAARRIIEEVLSWTEARVVILDPNADFRYLAKLGPGKMEESFAARWTLLEKDICLAAPDGAGWGIDWGKLSLDEMAAFLRISPKESFAEYRHLDRHFRYEKMNKKAGEDVSTKTGVKESLKTFLTSRYFDYAVGEELERYRFLLQELDNVKVWAEDAAKDLDSLLTANSRAVVVDLSIDDEEVRTMMAARTLEALWRQGEERRKAFLRNETEPWPGTLVVIDEGHMFAPPRPRDPQSQLVCDRIKRFADQGKKLNLYLLVITQQPGKLHRDVLCRVHQSNCDES